jgi:carbon starvation protein
MCLESLVAIMAMIAACTLEPGVYLAMNIKAPGADPAAVAQATVAKVNAFGPEYAVTTDRMTELAREVKEESLYGRTGGAATLAVGMANLFHRAMPVLGERWLGIWYHFALMFEALFILTTLDAGTRVGRYLLQDALGHLFKPMGDVRSIYANILASGAVVGLWGYFLIAAVYDPDGGIKVLWPIFGIANQLLAATALCLATTIVLKMALNARTGTATGKVSPALALVTLVPLLWLLTVTGTASVQKIWHSDPRIGFLAGAGAARASREALEAQPAPVSEAELSAQDKNVAQLARQSFNLTLNAWVTMFFLVLVAAIVLISVREWILLLARKKAAALCETTPTWLPDYAVNEGRPLGALGVLALLFGLAKELSGEAALARAEQNAGARVCECQASVNLLGVAERDCPPPSRAELFDEVNEHRFRGVNRCC